MFVKRFGEGRNVWQAVSARCKCSPNCLTKDEVFVKQAICLSKNEDWLSIEEQLGKQVDLLA